MYNQSIQQFSQTARQYCAWIESEKNKDQIFPLQQLLSKLHSESLELPALQENVELGEIDLSLKIAREKIILNFRCFPFQYYATIFDTTELNNPQASTGDIIDDLIDIYEDVKIGLNLYENGNEAEAIFHWRFSFGIHWGRHILSAMYALYCFERTS
ncbi:MAG: DUF5063 domain-containing protein [Bdellovibrionota bacterium]